MCIITNRENIIVSISLIPGVGTIPIGYNVYFPVDKNDLQEGDYYKPE